MKKTTYTFAIEVIAFYTILSLLNWFFFPYLLGFLDVDPHPFWLGILLFGFRYGVVAGFASGLLSAVVYMLATWTSGELYRFEELNYYILPSFFIIFGLLVGVFSSRSRERIAALESEKTDISKEKDLFADEIKTQKEINRGLEKKIVTRMATLVTLYEGARRLEAVHVEDLYPAIVKFMAKTLGAEEAALYLKDEDGWKIAHNVGWKDYQHRPPLLKHNEGLTGIAGASEKIVSIRDFIGADRKTEDLPEYLGDSVLSGPIRVGDKGDVIGVISIQKIPFYSLTSATISLFAFLLNWASRAIGNADYLRSLEEQEIIVPDLHVYSTKYFHRRIAQEFTRSQTYYLPLSVGVVHIPQMEILPRGKEHAVMLMMSQLLNESSRDIDVVAKFEDKTSPFAILWITTNEKQAEAMKAKIMANFHKLQLDGFDPPLDVRIGIASFSPKLSNVDEMIAKAQEVVRT